jgi:hypothetical protein
MLNNAVEAQHVCAHEDVELHCPFCSRTVGPDTLVCMTCKEMVAAVRVCIYCGEEAPECARTVPPHFPSMVLTESGAERCVECGGYGKIMDPHPLNDQTAPTYTDCPKCSADLTGETTAAYAKRMLTT